MLLTNHLDRTCPDLVTCYAQRMLIENGISEAIQLFHLDALSSMVRLKVDFDLQITLMASSLHRLMAARIGREYERAQAKRHFRNLSDVSATATISERGDRRVGHASPQSLSGRFRAGKEPTSMPWFVNKTLRIAFA